jgi:hypothetical protein
MQGGSLKVATRCPDFASLLSTKARIRDHSRSLAMRFQRSGTIRPLPKGYSAQRRSVVNATTTDFS